MKQIKAFIKPDRDTRVIDAPKENGFDCITLSKAEGTGLYKRPDAFPILEFKITDSLVVKLELVCIDEKVEWIASIISEYARSTESGDGIIYLSPVDSAYKVKTGDPIARF